MTRRTTTGPPCPAYRTAGADDLIDALLSVLAVPVRSGNWRDRQALLAIRADAARGVLRAAPHIPLEAVVEGLRRLPEEFPDDGTGCAA
ncbi:hypothetical protein [Nocardiopsis halophila]|uniref:hypothetical protein n=1 Tax=Nocardiopsis halophila TaxID=141692 RepID=UPI00034B2D97|nr:hypothetical protein [Nocardiopsis halophila]